MSHNKVLFVMLGQSNATGYNSPLDEKDKIKTPLKNVFGLEKRFNQFFDIEKVTWTGYVSSGTNLGEDDDDTYSVSNQLASIWQKRIDGGERLPDLYIITISVGAQGVTEKYMWYPKKPRVLKPGSLFDCDISLFELTRHVFSLVGEDFDAIQLHWRGGEEETEVDAEHLKGCLQDIYDELWFGFKSSLKCPFDLYLHKIVSLDRCKEIAPSGCQLKSALYVNSLFDFYAENVQNTHIFDARECPFYDPDITHNNLFFDGVHYKKEVNFWAAQKILENFKEKI